MPILGIDLGLATNPITVTREYDGDRTTEVLTLIATHIRALEADAFADKRLVALAKVFTIMLFRQNPF